MRGLSAPSCITVDVRVLVACLHLKRTHVAQRPSRLRWWLAALVCIHLWNPKYTVVFISIDRKVALAVENDVRSAFVLPGLQARTVRTRSRASVGVLPSSTARFVLRGQPMMYVAIAR
jgi:hypothetical protein